MTTPVRGPSGVRDHMGQSSNRQPEPLNISGQEIGVLSGVPHAAAREHGHQPRAGRRSTAFVAYQGRRFISNLVSRCAHSCTEVHVFTIEKEALVKSADGLDDGPAREQAAARKPLRISGMLIHFTQLHVIVGPRRPSEDAVQE